MEVDTPEKAIATSPSTGRDVSGGLDADEKLLWVACADAWLDEVRGTKHDRVC